MRQSFEFGKRVHEARRRLLNAFTRNIPATATKIVLATHCQHAAMGMVTGQLADAIGDFACLVFVLLAASARPRVVQSATCPVRELAVRELSSYHGSTSLRTQSR